MNAINTLVNEVIAENADKSTMTADERELAAAGALPSQTVALTGAGSHNPMEAVYRKKYPNLEIIPGSMIQEKDHSKFHNKIRVKVKCNCKFGDGPRCEEVVERATSDLFTFMGCESCKKVVRKQKQAEKALLSVAK